MKKIFAINSVIIGIFLLLAFSAEKIVNGGDVGIRELIASVFGGILGGLLSAFLLQKYDNDDSGDD
jgi:phosphotransferase system  glucose/maltose/N-acetylglucosamine-specific IIC component